MSEVPGLRRYLATRRAATLIVYALCAVLIVTLIAVAGHDLVRHIDAMKRWIAELGPWALTAFVALYVVVTSFLVPESVLAIMAGALFGLPAGLTAVVIGAALAAALQYWLARSLLRRRFVRAVAAKRELVAIRDAVLREELKIQMLLRATPLNPATLNYVLGATGVRFPAYLLGCVAMTPHLLLEVYVGFAGRHFIRAAGAARQTELHDVVLIVGLAAALAAVWYLSRTARRALLQAAREEPPGPSAASGARR